MNNNRISIVLSIKETIEILELFFNEKNFEDINYNYRNIKKKFKKKSISSFIEDFQLTIAVNNSFKETNTLALKHIQGIKQEKLALLFLRCLDTEFVDKSEKLNIVIITYKQSSFELEEYLNALTFLMDYSSSKNSKSIKISSLDEIISIDNPKELFIGVKKSITSTLTGKKDDNYFRVNPSTKDKLVPFSKLGKYKYLKNKYCHISCPLCNKKIKINKENLIEKIVIKNGIVKTLCHHQGTNHEEELPFAFNINDIQDDGKTLEEKAMFILNNFTYLVQKAKENDI